MEEQVAYAAVDHVVELFLRDDQDTSSVNEADSAISNYISPKYQEKQVELQRCIEADQLVRRLRKEAREREKRKKKHAETELKEREEETKRFQARKEQEQQRAHRIKMDQLERKRQAREARALERQRQFQVSKSLLWC